MMKTARRNRRFALWPRLLLSLFALLLVVLASPGAALAHPADVYLQATYITVAPTQLEVELDLSPGVLVAPQVLPLLDSNGDEQISDAESQAYVNSVLSQIELKADGAPVALTITKIDIVPYLNFQAGYGTIRVFATAALPANLSSTHVIDYRNHFAPAGSAYQVNTFVEKNAAITLGTQNRDDIQQSISVDYTIGAAPTSAAASTAATTETWASSSSQSQQLLVFLQAPALSPWVLVLALALAAILTWYVINPVPRPSPQTRLKDGPPEADRHPEGIRLGESSRWFEKRPGRMPTARPSLIADEALPEWPEYLDLD